MRLGRVIAALACATIPLWRVLVVGINDAAAIRRARWIDSSIWLGEDPLSSVETAIAAGVTSSSASDRMIMVTVEVAGICLWATVAVGVYLLLRRTAVFQRLDRLVVGGAFVTTMTVGVLVCAYLGGFWRTSLAEAVGIRDVAIRQWAAIATFIGAGSIPLFIGTWWRLSRANDGTERPAAARQL